MRRGAAFWFTGLPGSGKSTLALAARGHIPSLVILHMDEMRKVVTPAPTYSEQERDHLYLGIVYTAMILTREGKDVVIDATATFRRWRAAARNLIPNFHEIYIKCPLEICMERERTRRDIFAPADVYKKAEAGWPVPGVNVPYEEPESPELVVDFVLVGLEGAEEAVVGYIGRALSAL